MVNSSEGVPGAQDLQRRQIDRLTVCAGSSTVDITMLERHAGTRRSTPDYYPLVNTPGGSRLAGQAPGVTFTFRY